MIKFRWTGAGCLSPVLLVVTLVAAGGMAAAVDGDGIGGSTPGVAIALTVLAGGALHWLFARWLNSTATPEGRDWHDEHTVADEPIQTFTIIWVLLALVIAANVVGRSTSPILGWVTLGSVLLAIPVIYSSYRARRRLAGMGAREELAREQGWRYQAKAPDLPQRWKALAGWRTYSMAPYGVIGGELDGVPFTVFDSDVGLDGRTAELPQTIWAVHLPVTYPQISATVSSAPFNSMLRAVLDDGIDFREAVLQQRITADDLEAETEIPALGQVLLTREVREAMLADELVGWRIEGRDLLFTSLPRPSPPAADEIVEVARRLVALARLFPPTAAERYGREPTTDIPLPIADP